ncbi:C40 family peptidase [Nostocoides sp. HKS02]|uniref:C40 family peptidase n=1 Tax=Nostocoides sp. HKS02 TaxID=1813880 RepID=UPI001E529D33|nr:C40 family peptidase [Tetrasphaera sp. HKS02]
MVGFGGDTAFGDAPTCTSTRPVRGLSQAQAANARTVVAVAAARGGDPAAHIALMVALAESNLLVLVNPHDPAGAAYTNQGVGYDHDSLGLFQQRPGWGTAAQRMDPATSTELFLDRLLATPAWSSLPPAYVAQLVQRSAYDGIPSPANHFSATVGANYLARQGQAALLLGQIQPAGQGPDCGSGKEALAPGAEDTLGLPHDWTIPAFASRAAATTVQFALAQLGKPYQWGATGPDRYDCSGLTQAAWLRAGVSISRTTYDQMRDGVATDPAHLQPGDLVLTPGSDGSLAVPGHVGLYIGKGLVVVAPKTGDVVKVVTYGSFAGSGISALRHIA